MSKANSGFISDFYCELCGKRELVPSTVKLQANYGSRNHDGEDLTLCVCGDCIDRLFNYVDSLNVILNY